MHEQVGRGAVAHYRLGLGIDERFTRTDGTGTYSYLVDALGSTVALADAAGAIPTECTYEPYGATTITGTGNANPGAVHRAGGGRDRTVLLPARYYDPWHQRFVNEDPIGLAAGPNLFLYALASPMRFRDPLGLDVVNNSPTTVWVKPEASGRAVPVPPGTTYTHPQDGVAVPQYYPNEVYKTVDGVDIVVNSDGTVSIPGWWDWAKRTAAEAVGRGGWKDHEWHKERKGKGDNGWDEIFDKSSSRKDPAESGDE